jgi:MoaA/NifB/PqqE/SkfB family radical SAM enzyme
MNPKDYFHNPAFCTLPWIGIYVGPSGNIKNCAIGGQNLGNIHEQQLGDIVDSKKNIDIKQTMLQAQFHPRCKVCYSVDNNASHPSLSESNRNWYKKISVNYVNLDFYDDPANHSFKVLDLRWRNTCNQACVYCSSDLSSRWASELGHKIHIADKALQDTKHHIFKNIDKVRHVYLAGGEPLLIKENEELLDLLLDRNPDIEIRVNTNLSNINGPVFKKLSRFANVKWTISVDAVEEQYEYIRWPGIWKDFLFNLRYLQGQSQEINYNMVWCVLNHRSIFDCIDFLQENNGHENMFVVQCLTSPASLSVMNLPPSELDALADLISKRMEQCKSRDWWLHKSLVSMYNFVENQPNIGMDLQDTFVFLKEIDQRRHLSSQSVFPEIYKFQ